MEYTVHGVAKSQTWLNGFSVIRNPKKSARLLCSWNSPGKITGVDGHSLLQGIFPTQGSNLHLLNLPHCWEILYHLSHQGSPRGSLIHLDLEVKKQGSRELKCHSESGLNLVYLNLGQYPFSNFSTHQKAVRHTCQEGQLRHRPLNFIPRASDSISLGRGLEFAFLTISHVMLILLVVGPHFKIP